MHDYDRRRTASDETTTTTKWWTLDADELVSEALREHQARLDRTDPVHYPGPNEALLTGTTTDGRTFRIEVTFSVRNMTMTSVAKTRLEGGVSLGPVPDVLLRVETLVASLLALFKQLDVESDIGRNFTRGMTLGVQPKIDAWRRGDPVDKVALRSSLRNAEGDLKTLEFKNPKDRGMVPPGESRELWQIVDEARKALGAAARNVK